MSDAGSRGSAVADAPEARRPSPTSVLLVVLAVLGIVVTFAFGMWMIGFADSSTPFLNVPPAD